MNEHNILITDCIVVPMTYREPLYFKGSVGVSGNKIVMVEPEHSAAVEAFRRRAEQHHITEIDGQGMIALPGLINTHNHVAMSLLRGYADDMPLMEWLNERIWPFENAMTRDDVKTGAKLGIAEMLLGGTTTFVDMYKMQEAVAEAVMESGIRGVLTSAVTDNWMADFESDLKTILNRYGSEGNNILRFMLAPHAPYTNSEQTLLRIKELCSKYNLGINIHMAETRDEIDIIRQRYGKTPVQYLDDLGLISGDTLLVHCVWLDDNDIDIIAAAGASVAHCPESNMKLSSGICRIKDMMDKGINVTIGTDGPSSNNDLDMWGEMRSASFLQKLSTGDPKVLTAYEILRMATAGGAKAVGMDGKLGVLKPGALADIILLDARQPHLYPRHDVIANLVYAGKSSDVDTVIIDGRFVVRGKELLTLKTTALYREAQQSAEEIKKRIAG